MITKLHSWRTTNNIQRRNNCHFGLIILSTLTRHHRNFVSCCNICIAFLLMLSDHLVKLTLRFCFKGCDLVGADRKWVKALKLEKTTRGLDGPNPLASIRVHSVQHMYISWRRTEMQEVVIGFHDTTTHDANSRTFLLPMQRCDDSTEQLQWRLNRTE